MMKGIKSILPYAKNKLFQSFVLIIGWHTYKLIIVIFFTLYWARTFLCGAHVTLKANISDVFVRDSIIWRFMSHSFKLIIFWVAFIHMEVTPLSSRTPRARKKNLFFLSCITKMD